MQTEKHTLLNEFPDHHHTIRHLKMHDAHFVKMFNAYHDVEDEVHQLEKKNSPVDDEYLETLKKRRLQLKDELYIMIQKTEQAL
mmetsp:Transcript_70698/g.223838  ORF Transcript_70698/g.223838 Transcript_70698/m.223838 type:complete len:84 (+) Transcript_70698:32-283(+)